MTDTGERDNDFTDLLKLTGVFMVFAMHSQAFSDYGRLSMAWELMSRWAVPFLFTTSAYFLFRKFPQRNAMLPKEALGKYVSRIGLLYIGWFMINIPNIYVSRLANHNLHDAETWLCFLKNSLLSSTFTGSWYLLSCIFSATAIFLLSRRLSTAKILAIGVLTEATCILTSAYARLLPESVEKVLLFLDFPLNIFGGVFYFALGKHFAENRTIATKTGFTRCLILATACYGLYILEIWLTKRYGFYSTSDQAIFLVPASTFLFLLSQNTSVRIPRAKTLRKASTIIFCAQGDILLAEAAFRKFSGSDSMLLSFGVGTILTGIVVATILVLQGKESFGWLKHLS